MYKFFSLNEIDGITQINDFKHHNKILITPWTISHFIWGYLFYLLGINYFWGFMIHSLYEYVNLTYDSFKKKWGESYDGFRSDSFFNTIGDTIFFMLGMILANHYNNTYLFTINFIVGFIFFSPSFQNILTINRMKYINKLYPKIKVNKIKNYTLVDHYLWLIWIIVNILYIIKFKFKKQISF